MKRSELTFSLLQIPIDFIMIVAAGIAAYFLRTSAFVSQIRPIQFDLPFFEYLGFLFLVGFSSLIFFALAGLYQLKITRSLIREIFLVLLSVTAGVVAIALWVFLTANPFESRFIILFWWVLAVIFVSMARIALKKVQQYLLVHYGLGIHNVLLIGHPNPGRSKEFLLELKQSPNLGFQVVSEVMTIKVKDLEPIVKSKAVDDIFLTDLSWSEETIFELAQFAHRMQLGFSFVPSMFGSFRTALRPLPSGLALLEVKHTPLEGWGKIFKRVVDVIGALIGLGVLAVIFPFIALLIKLNSKGPIFVGLKRIREGGEMFELYKFRTMIDGAHKLKRTVLRRKNERKYTPLFKMRYDPRITRVGKVLRRFRIDEFPNFYNVLEGDMSLVGPRPHEPEEVARYKKHHLRVLSIKPGVSGLAQISGSSDLPFDREVELDTYYIEHWSILLDLYILARTLVFIFRDKSAV